MLCELHRPHHTHSPPLFCISSRGYCSAAFQQAKEVTQGKTSKDLANTAKAYGVFATVASQLKAWFERSDGVLVHVGTDIPL